MTHPLFEIWLKDSFPQSDISEIQKNAARETFKLLFPEIERLQTELRSAQSAIAEATEAIECANNWIEEFEN